MTEQQLKKGLFRLWIVVSVCWFLIVVIGMFTVAITGGKVNWGDFVVVLCLLLSFPVILLYLGKVSFWIVQGFKKESE